MAHERHESNVSQLSDCYQNVAFSQTSLFFYILMVDLFKVKQFYFELKLTLSVIKSVNPFLFNDFQ